MTPSSRLSPPSPIGTDAELAAQHHVEGQRSSAAALVAELQARDFRFFAVCLVYSLTHQIGKQAAEVQL